MKVFSVVGYSGSGKTTTIEGIIRSLKNRGYRVGSLKDIHFEGFAIDTEGTNSYRHKAAGSSLVTARGFHETDILFQERLSLGHIAAFYDVDYLVLEGLMEASVPLVLAGRDLKDLDEKFDKRVFAVTGRVADNLEEYRGLPAISVMKDPEALVDLIEEKTFPLLPDVDPDCCSACGLNCRLLCQAILSGDKVYEDCVVNQSSLELTIGDKVIPMVPFVQRILRNSILGVVSELDGYMEGKTIEIRLKGEWE